MTTQYLRISELMAGMESEFGKHSNSYTTQLYNLRCCQVIINLHETHGLEYLDRKLIAQYIEQLNERRDSGDLGRRYYDGLLRNVKLLLEYHDTGKLSWRNPAAGSTYKLTPEFQRIADDYLESVSLHPNTHNDARWVSHKYFTWLAEQGHTDLADTRMSDLQAFMVACSKSMAPTSMHDIKLHLRKLYDYLTTADLTDIPYKAFLSFKVNRESKIYPCVPKEDIAAILDAVDRKTKRGKRDYAILLLGAVIGLRAVDVVNMKLGDIDWVRGEIKLTQSKTGQPVVLPLTQDVGEAIQEYILRARPSAETQKIFLRINSPVREIASAATVGEIYNDWRRAAKLPESKSFHSLRRTLGRDMVTTGTSVIMVVQVFGGRNINSAKKYISLDSKHLKLCALPFDGISPIGGDAE